MKTKSSVLILQEDKACENFFYAGFHNTMAFFNLTTCNNLIDAYMLKHMLENEGIPCFLHNEQTANLLPSQTGIYHVGVMVMIHKRDTEKALRLLNQ